MHGVVAQNHGRSAAGIARKGAARHRLRDYRNGSHRVAVGRCLAGLCAIAPASRARPIYANVSGVEGRSVIAADTSTWIAFLQGESGSDADLLDHALQDRQVLMPPVVLTE